MDTMSECDMQQNYRFNDIVLPGQNWVTDQPANARGQRVRKRGRRGGVLLRIPRRNLLPSTTVYAPVECSLLTQQYR